RVATSPRRVQLGFGSGQLGCELTHFARFDAFEIEAASTTPAVEVGAGPASRAIVSSAWRHRTSQRAWRVGRPLRSDAGEPQKVARTRWVPVSNFLTAGD